MSLNKRVQEIMNPDLMVSDQPDKSPPPKEKASSSLLTPRAMQVLEALALGQTNREIGLTLKISVKTVEAHRSRIFEKLGAGNGPQAVVMAFRAGLLKAPLSGYSTKELTDELNLRNRSQS